MVTHFGECRAFVNVLTVDVAVTFRAQFLESRRAWFRAGITSMTPCFTNTTTANTLEVMTPQFLGADTMSIIEVTGLLTLIDTTCGGVVERQSRWASTSERTFRVHANTASFANAWI